MLTSDYQIVELKNRMDKLEEILNKILETKLIHYSTLRNLIGEYEGEDEI